MDPDSIKMSVKCPHTPHWCFKILKSDLSLKDLIRIPKPFLPYSQVLRVCCISIAYGNR